MRTIRAAPAFALLMLLGACTNSGSSTTPATDPPTPPVTAAIAPGECQAPEELADVAINTGGETYAPTFGVGSSDCAGATGNGYLVFGYEPILIEAGPSMEIVVTGDALVSITWTGPELLTELPDGRWKIAKLSTGCQRLSIVVESLSGDSRATFGADIRSGGPTVECLIRNAPTPIDPTDIAPIDTSGTETSIEAQGSLVLPTLAEPTPITNP